jgi:hypothetical protein
MEPSEDGMRWQLVAVLVFVAVIGIVGWWSLRAKHTPPSSQPATAPARTSSSEQPAAGGTPLTQNQLELDILRDGLMPERAKPLFSVVIGPLHGVTISVKPSTDPADFDVTSAIDNLYQV